MALIKIGSDYYKGKETPVYLVSGTATRDAEGKNAGDKKLSTVGIAASKKKNEETVYINVNGWRARYRDVLAIRKLDSILAIGTLKEREYNGKKYYDLDADFVCKSGAGLSAVAASAEESAPPEYCPDEPPVGTGGDGFAELEEDGELPF